MRKQYGGLEFSQPNVHLFSKIAATSDVTAGSCCRVQVFNKVNQVDAERKKLPEINPADVTAEH